jgi:hypothetical protein
MLGNNIISYSIPNNIYKHSITWRLPAVIYVLSQHNIGLIVVKVYFIIICIILASVMKWYYSVNIVAKGWWPIPMHILSTAVHFVEDLLRVGDT